MESLEPTKPEPREGDALFAPEHFFELSGFRYRAIFATAQNVWEAIGGIHAFLSDACAGLPPTGEDTIVSPGAFLDGELIILGSGCVIEPGAYVRGPVLIGDNVTIRQGAYIRGDVIIGDNAVVGHATEIKNSILLNKAQAPHFAYVGDSILGNRVNLGAGTRLSNLGFSHGDVVVRARGVTRHTGLRKFGAVLGDDAQTGCNVVLNPGTLVGPRSLIYPSCSLGGHVPADTIVKLRQDVIRRPRPGNL